ncbi:MAG: hypothetical protein ACK42I_09235 [Thermomicrobium sp.]
MTCSFSSLPVFTPGEPKFAWGEKVTMVGLLATILCVLQLHRYGITVSLRQHCVLGLLVFPAILLIGTLLIWLQT